MQGDGEVYVGLDVSKLKVSVALAEAGRDGEVRFLGEVENTPEADRAAGGEARETAPAARLLLRGRPDRLRPPPAGHRPRPRLRRGRPLADPEAAGRAGQDQPARRPHAGAPAPRRRAHPGLDPRSRPRGGAGAGARPRGRDGGAAPRPPAPAVVPAPPRPGLRRPRALDQGARAMAGRAGLRPPRPAAGPGGVPAGGRGRRDPARAPDPAGRGGGGRVVHGAGGRGLPGAARRRLPDRGHLRGRDRRRAAVRQPAPADGLPRPGALGELDRRAGPARRDHQGRQRPGAAGAGRGRLDATASRRA